MTVHFAGLAGAAGASSGSGSSSDPDFSSVELLLSFDGADGSTTFTDSSSNAHSSTAGGNAQIDTAQSKFGGASGYFDGSSDVLTTPTDASLSFGSGDLTLEFFVRFTSVGATRYFMCSNAVSPFFWMNTNGNKLQAYFGSGNMRNLGDTSNFGDTTLVNNQWYHIALVRSGSSVTLYLDGAAELLKTDTNDFGASRAIQIGGGSGIAGTGAWHLGWIDELRFTKGVARYTSAFTPPTEPFPTS